MRRVTLTPTLSRKRERGREAAFIRTVAKTSARTPFSRLREKGARSAG